MNNSSKLNIHTGTYSDKAYDILTRLQIYMLNKSRRYAINFAHADINIQSNGSVVWDVYTDERRIIKVSDVMYATNSKSFEKSIYTRRNKNHQEIRIWIANTLKSVTCLCLSKEYWKRDNQTIIPDFSGTYTNIRGNKDQVNLAGDISVSDVYCLYDILKNTKNINKLYPKDQLINLIGNERDMVHAQFDIIYNEELIKLRDNYYEVINKFKKEYYNKIDLINEKYNWPRRFKSTPKSRMDAYNKELNEARVNFESIKNKETEAYNLTVEQFKQSFKTL